MPRNNPRPVYLSHAIWACWLSSTMTSRPSPCQTCLLALGHAGIVGPAEPCPLGKVRRPFPHFIWVDEVGMCKGLRELVDLYKERLTDADWRYRELLNKNRGENRIGIE